MTIYHWDTHTSYNIDNIQQCKALMEKLDKEPEQLIEFYKFICNIQNRLYEVKPELLTAIANRIKILDENGKLDGKQIKKIIEINAYIHPHIANEGIKSNISSFFQANLNTKNVFECLRAAKQNNNELFVRECLKFIEVKGSNITEITLNQLDEVNLKFLLYQCPNLETLEIQGNNNITQESLEGLHKLHKLKKLQLWSCKNLQGLPPLPESLESLFLRSCPKIQELPRLPNHLQSLRLQMCNNIHTLRNLPESLTILDLSICPNLKCHPDLPEGLCDVMIQALPEAPEKFLQKCLANTLDENLEKGLAVCKSCQYIEKKDIEKVLASKLDAAIKNKQNDIVEKILCNVLNIQYERAEGLFEVSIVDKGVHIDIYKLHIKPEEIQKIRKYLSEIYTGKDVAIRFTKETVNQLNTNIKEFLHETSDWEDVSKARLSALINEWDTLINLCYEYQDWDTLKALQASSQDILNLYGDTLRGVISILNANNAEILSDKLHTIYEKLEDKYLDANRLLKGSFDDKPISPAHFQWYLSQAILQEKAEKLDPIQRKQLYLVMLQAYRKAAGFAEAESLNTQTTPLFPQQKGYYRHDEWEVTKKCTEAYAKKMSFTEKMYLIDNPLFKQVMVREIFDPGLGTDIETVENFSSFLSSLQGYMQSYRSHDQPFLVDISKLMENQKITPANLKSLIDFLQDAFRKRFGGNMDMASKIQLMAFVKYEGQDVLLLPRFFGKDNTQAQTSIETVLNHSGYRPSPSQIIEAWIKVEDPKNILQGENIPLATLATGKQNDIPTICNNCAELAQTVIVKQFEDLSSINNAPPYLKVLAKSTANMVKGLVNCNIDASFKEKGMEDLLQISYFKILNAMHEAIHRQGNYIEFANQIGIIHGEIQSILTLVAPYKEIDLEQAVIDNLTKDPSIVPSDLERPKVHLLASGMHSLASVLAALEAQKGHTGINALVLYDTYFESTKIVRGAKNYNINVINPNKDGEGTVQYVSGSFARAKQPNDLYLCEFHHNICFGRKYYYPENILKQVKFLRHERNIAKPCTVVIDTTINLDHADNVREFLADDEIKKAIKDGELNVVLLRSAQKFDMLGQDNYYGGITITINNGEKFVEFNERMNDPQDQLKDANYQGLTHLQKYGDLDAYRRAIRENTEKLYNNLPSSIVGHGIDMVVSKMEKDNLYFLDIKFGSNTSTASAFKDRLLKFAKERNLPLTTRSSFGFANTNLSIIDNNIFRLNPGLDDEKTLQQYAEFFKAVAATIDKVINGPDKLVDYVRDLRLAKEIFSMDIPQEPNFDRINEMQIDEALSEAYTPAEEQKIQGSMSVTGKHLRPSNMEEDEKGHKVKKQKNSSFSGTTKKKRKRREDNINDILIGNENLPPPKKHKNKQ